MRERKGRSRSAQSDGTSRNRDSSRGRDDKWYLTAQILFYTYLSYEYFTTCHVSGRYTIIHHFDRASFTTISICGGILPAESRFIITFYEYRISWTLVIRGRLNTTRRWLERNPRILTCFPEISAFALHAKWIVPFYLQPREKCSERRLTRLLAVRNSMKIGLINDRVARERCYHEVQ